MNKRWNPAGVIALGLSAIAFVAVNFWVYAARARFLAADTDYARPPTISRAITLPEITAPFSVWVSLSGILLILAVAILAWHYQRVGRVFTAPAPLLAFSFRFGPALVMALQCLATWGMVTLSSYTLVTGPGLHMQGSYAFFGAQAAVILVYTLGNYALLRDPRASSEAVAAGGVDRTWLLWRVRAGWIILFLAIIYAALFKLKDFFPYEETPIVQQVYVQLEPVVITGFLTMIMMACMDKLRRV